MDYENCVYRNSIVDKLVKECTKIFDENKIYNETLNTTSSNDSLSDCVSYTPCIVLFAVLLVTSVLIGSVFIYFYWYSQKHNDQLYLEKDHVRIKFNPSTQTAIHY